MKPAKVAAALAALALLHTEASAALPSGLRKAVPCMEAKQADALMLMFAPPLFRSLGEACNGHLSADSPLADPDSAFIRKFELAADDEFDSALAGIGRLTGTELPPGLDRKTVRQLVTAFMPKDLVKNIKPEQCGAIERLVVALAPLPPANFASVVTSIVVISQKDEKGDGDMSGKGPDFNICPIQPG